MHCLKILSNLKIFFLEGGLGGWLYYEKLCSSYSIPLYSWPAFLWRVIYGDFHHATPSKWTFTGSECILFQHIDPICSHSWWMISVCKENGCFWDEMIKNLEVWPHTEFIIIQWRITVFIGLLFIEWPLLCAPLVFSLSGNCIHRWLIRNGPYIFDNPVLLYTVAIGNSIKTCRWTWFMCVLWFIISLCMFTKFCCNVNFLEKQWKL